MPTVTLKVALREPLSFDKELREKFGSKIRVRSGQQIAVRTRGEASSELGAPQDIILYLEGVQLVATYVSTSPPTSPRLLSSWHDNTTE